MVVSIASQVSLRHRMWSLENVYLARTNVPGYGLSDSSSSRGSQVGGHEPRFVERLADPLRRRPAPPTCSYAPPAAAPAPSRRGKLVDSQPFRARRSPRARHRASTAVPAVPGTRSFASVAGDAIFVNMRGEVDGSPVIPTQRRFPHGRAPQAFRRGRSVKRVVDFGRRAHRIRSSPQQQLHGGDSIGLPDRVGGEPPAIQSSISSRGEGK